MPSREVEQQLDGGLGAVEQVPHARVAITVDAQQRQVAVDAVVGIGDVVLREQAAEHAVLVGVGRSRVEIHHVRLAVQQGGGERLHRRVPLHATDAAEAVLGKDRARAAVQVRADQGRRAVVHAVGGEHLARICSQCERREHDAGPGGFDLLPFIIAIGSVEQEVIVAVGARCEPRHTARVKHEAEVPYPDVGDQAMGGALGVHVIEHRTAAAAREPAHVEAVVGHQRQTADVAEAALDSGHPGRLLVAVDVLLVAAVEIGGDDLTYRRRCLARPVQAALGDQQPAVAYPVHLHRHLVARQAQQRSLRQVLHPVDGDPVVAIAEIPGKGDMQPVRGQARRADGVGDGEGLDRDRFDCLDPCGAQAQRHRDGDVLPVFHAFSPATRPRPLQRSMQNSVVAGY